MQYNGGRDSWNFSNLYTGMQYNGGINSWNFSNLHTGMQNHIKDIRVQIYSNNSTQFLHLKMQNIFCLQQAFNGSLRNFLGNSKLSMLIWTLIFYIYIYMVSHPSIKISKISWVFATIILILIRVIPLCLALLYRYYRPMLENIWAHSLMLLL